MPIHLSVTLLGNCQAFLEKTKKFSVSNALAYYAQASIMAKTVFIELLYPDKRFLPGLIAEVEPCQVGFQPFSQGF